MKISITGGGGYCGATLVPYLLKKKHKVTVLDTFWFGDHLTNHPNLRKITGDIRKKADLVKAFHKADAIIHLACISNDPSFDMSPQLGKEINYDCFANILTAVKDSSAERFIYASSSSVYGVSDKPSVDEQTICKPLTDYSKYKLACEIMLRTVGTRNAAWTIVRPATLCGYSPRMRLDLVVNAMTIKAITQGVIPVHGGKQLRPNLHVKDMARAYEALLLANEDLIHTQTFNVGDKNFSLGEIAEKVKTEIPAKIEIEESKDERSYHIDSSLFNSRLNFETKYTLSGAIISIEKAMSFNMLKNPLENTDFYNILKIKELGL